MVDDFKKPMKNYELQDILAGILDVINKPELCAFRELVVGMLGVHDPMTGVAMGAINRFISDYNSYKLSLLLKGLSTNLNMEKCMNELYNYVSKSDENAINVANVFKEAINAESPKVCLIYGLIIADHLDGNNGFTQEELIVCKALENGTDNDLCLFKDIMDLYLIKEDNDRESIVLPSNIENNYIITCDWCLYNRLFIMESVKVENTTLINGRFYYTTTPAKILLKYINDLSRIWNY